LNRLTLFWGTSAPRRWWTISDVGTGGLDLVSRWRNTATCAVFARQTRRVRKGQLAYSTHSLFPIDCGSIGMDFVGPFPKSQGYDYPKVIICRLTSKVYQIPVNTMVKASELSSIYIKELVPLHRLPDSIVSNCDSNFTLRFWRILGTN
jgi:hypothetical protein